MDILSQAKQDIAEGNLEQAIKKLLSIALPSQYEEQIILLSSRFEKITKDNNTGIVNREEHTIETNKISSSILAFVKDLQDTGIELNDNQDSDGIKISSDILEVVKKLYYEKNNNNKTIDVIQNNGKDILKKLEETIGNIINDMEGKGVSSANQGKIMAIAENLNFILKGTVEENIVGNLSKAIDHAKYSRALVFEDVSKKQEAIFALQMAKGYLSALIEVS